MASLAAHGPAAGVTDPLRPAAAFPSRVLHQDEQFQRHQPFYVPNTQPVLPYQWPMSAPYVPYTGFPGLGYGMMMPSLLFPPCLEMPGYMIPHSQLHMLDHRRVINPHMAPNISHQAQRFRYQNSVPLNRVMVSSEVQTEPASHSSSQDSRAGSESGRGTGCDSPVSVLASFSENKSVACPVDTPVFTHDRVVATNTINTSNRKSEIRLQAERVQIKCSETPSTFKIVHTNETTELASNDAGDLLQCSLGSIRSEDVVLCSYQSLAFRKDKQGIEAGNLKYLRKHCLPACKEMAKVKHSCAAFKAYPKLTGSKSFEANRSSEMQLHKTSNRMKCKRDTNSSHNVHYKILRLPFETQTCRLEASVWSVESLLPYVPSSNWLIGNGLVTPPQKSAESDEPIKPPSQDLHKSSGCPLRSRRVSSTRRSVSRLDASVWSVESLVPSSNWLIGNGLVTPPQKSAESDAVPAEKNHHAGEPIKPHSQDLDKSSGCPLRCRRVSSKRRSVSKLEASVWSVESLVPYVPSRDWLIGNGLVTPTQNSPEGDAVSAKKPRQTDEPVKPHSQDLHKSLSPYHPSTSWLADFGNVYYYSKLPALQQKLSSFGKSPEKQLHKVPEGKWAINPELSPSKHERKTRNQRAATRRNISDQKLHSCHSYKCTAKSPSKDAGRDVRCDWPSHFSGGEKIPHCSRQNDTRDQDHRKHLTSHSLCCRREENAAVKTSDKHRPDAQKIILGSYLTKSHQTTLNEADLCKDCRCLHAGAAQSRCDKCGPGVWKQNKEDCVSWRWREAQQRPQRDMMHRGGKIQMSTSGRHSHPMTPVKAY